MSSYLEKHNKKERSLAAALLEEYPRGGMYAFLTASRALEGAGSPASLRRPNCVVEIVLGSPPSYLTLRESRQEATKSRTFTSLASTPHCAVSLFGADAVPADSMPP